MLKKVFAGVLALLLVVLSVVVAISWKASEDLLNPADDAPPERPAGLPVQDVTFESSDGVTLSGWYTPPPACLEGETCPPAPGVVLSHGRGSNRGAFNDEMVALHGEGFATLAFDYRGMGESENVTTTAGALEQQDLDAAVDRIVSEERVDDAPVGVIGKSLGASIAILSAADNQNIGAVVDEAGFAKLSDVVEYNFKKETGMPPFPFAGLSIEIAERRAGVNLDDVEPGRVVGQLSPRPLLVVHARDDARVRYDQSEKVIAAAGEPKQLVTLDGNVHANSISVDKTQWRARVVPFLRDALNR